MRLERHQLDVDGQTREYLWGLPSGGTGTPAVVVAFHGAGSNAEGMRHFTRLEEKAEQEGFAVVFPEGTGRTAESRSWNAGAPHVYAAKHEVNDARFFQALLDALRETIDESRVYLTGMSNGGLLCYFLANQAVAPIRAIAPVACATLDLTITCPEPMPVLHIHGTADAYVPYEGGRGGRTAAGTVFQPVERMIEAWARHNGCELPGHCRNVHPADRRRHTDPTADLPRRSGCPALHRDRWWAHLAGHPHVVHVSRTGVPESRYKSGHLGLLSGPWGK